MSKIQHILLAIILSIAIPCFAATTADNNSITLTTIQLDLSNLAAKKLPENEAAVAKTNLEQALQFITQRDDNESKLENLKKQLITAPAETESIRQQLEKLTATPPKHITIESVQKFTDTDLQLRLNENNSKLSTWQISLVDTNNTILHSQTRPEQTQTLINDLQTRLQEIATQLKANQTDEARLRLQAEQLAINSQIALLRHELASSNLLQELATNRKSLLTEQIQQVEQENLQLQNIINERRRTATEKAVEDATKAQTNLSNDLVRTESDTNLRLSEYLLLSTDKLNTLSQRNLQTKQQLDSVNQVDETLNEQTHVLKGSILLFKILYQQKKALPSVTTDNTLSDEIANLRLYQFSLAQERDKFSRPSIYVNNLLTTTANDNIDNASRQKLLELARTRQQLFTDLQYTLNNLSTEAVNLQLTQKQLRTKVSQISTTIDNQMFWLPSNPVLNMEWMKNTPTLFKTELSGIYWQEILLDISHGLIDRPWLFVPLALLIILLIWKRNKIRQHIQSLNQDIGNVKHDSQTHTPLAIILNILIALPVSLAFALAGIALLLDGQGLNVAYGNSLLEVAFGWLIFYTAYRLFSPNSVATLHFYWDSAQVLAMRRQIWRIGAISLVLMVVVTITSQHLDNLANDVIGIVTVIVCYLILALLLGRTLFSKETRIHLSFLRWLLAIALVSLPLILMIATIMGYYYTALKLTARLVDTLYIILIWILAEAVFIRGLSVAARRLAYQRAIEKRQNILQSREQGDDEIIEEPVLDIQEINQQSLRLIRLGLLALFGFILYWIWADVLAVFSYLDSITLYQYIGVDGATLVPLTLKAFIVAIIIATVALILTHNLPGLLEVIILSRLNLERGISYAITTLLSYAIIAIGATLTLGILGVSWNKLQWLVAALTFGLGFGLQEIFTNFVSGIILLFERPIRIGDRITVAGVTGTVNRIQIRATRITDGDRKEVIIPNKTFATGQLINWTLTDTITRITLKVGVGYDSDLDKVKALLLQAANENPRVIKDPGPSVSFIGFGASTLDHELTMLVNEIADRGAASDEINRRILKLFNKANIDIAFNQLDVVLKNNQGNELQLMPTKVIQDKNAKSDTAQ